jgi:hypothetical protein
MTTVRRTELIDASADEVWAVLADFASISTWADFVDHSSLMSEQNEGVGMQRRIQMDRTTVVETVTAWEPGVMFSYSITGLPPVIKSVTNTWRIGASGDSTMVWITTEVDTGPRPPQQAIAKGVARRLAKSSDAMLAGLAAHLTSEQKAS